MRRRIALVALAVLAGLAFLLTDTSDPSVLSQTPGPGGMGSAEREHAVSLPSDAMRSEVDAPNGVSSGAKLSVVFQVLGAVDLQPQPFSHVGFVDPALGALESDAQGMIKVDFADLPKQVLVAVGGLDLAVFTTVEKGPIPILVPTTIGEVQVCVRDPYGAPIMGASVLARLSHPDIMQAASLIEVNLGLTRDDGKLRAVLRPGTLVYATKPGWASSLHARVRGSEVELALRPAGALLVQLEPANTEAQAPNWSQFAVSVSRQVAIRGKTWRLDASTEQQACAEDGSARFEGVPGGSAYVQAYDRDGLFWASGSFDVNVQTLNTIKLTPRPRLRPLAVTVCDEHGKRIAGAEIRMTFGGERFAQRTDGDGHVSVVVSGVANMRSPSGQYGSICGWHPDVGQGVMTIHGDVLAGGATLVLRRLCSVRVVPRLRENGPVVLEVSQTLTRAEVASYSLLCESSGRDVAIGASSAKITMRRNGFVVGFAEVSCEMATCMIEELATGAVRGEVRSGGELAVGGGYLHLRDIHSGLREAIGVNADGSLLPARVPLGEYAVEYYDEASAMAMALTSATVRVLPGDASWILVAIPKDGLLQGTVGGPAGLPVEVEITREAEREPVMTFQALTGIPWSYGIAPGGYSVTWGGKGTTKKTLTVTVGAGRVSEVVCR